jgi:hypothetical protein
VAGRREAELEAMLGYRTVERFGIWSVVGLRSLAVTVT